MVKIVIVDSDAIFALYNPNDPLNVKAAKVFQHLISEDYQIIYPTSVIFEVVSLFQRVIPSPKVTDELIKMIQHEQIPIHIVDEDILKESAKLFDQFGSKKNTLIDCSVAAFSKKLKADGVFAFDNFYTKQGIKLASDLFSLN